jgi:DNA replication protein DnaC
MGPHRRCRCVDHLAPAVLAGNPIERLLRHDFIVIDDLGFTALDRVAADHLFRFIAAAYEQRSRAIITNVDFERWTQFLPDAATASAILDCFLHHRHVIALDSESSRLREGRQVSTPA